MKTIAFSKGLGRIISACLFAGLLVLPAIGSAIDRLVVKDVAGDTKFVVTDQGKVGIWTTNPFYTVQLKSSTSPYMNAEGIGLGGGLFPSRNYSATSNPAAGDVLGTVFFVGNDTLSNLSGTAATISGACDSTGGTRIKGRLVFSTSNGTTNTERMRIDSFGYVGIGTTTPSYPLHMASGAHVTTGGVWTNASSRDFKENIKSLSSEEAMSAVRNLNPVTFSYKTDKDESHVGFVAEDVPDLVASKDRKGLSAMDITAVLTKVVQEQQKMISELTEEVNALKREVRYHSDRAAINSE